MVKALDRKLWRDLRLMWSQVLTIALVVASGVAGFVTCFSAYDALSWSRERYYADARFADVFASLKRAPLALERELQALPGAAQVQTALTQVVPINLVGVDEPLIGRMIGLDLKQAQRLNSVYVRSGRLPQPGSAGIEVVVSEAFAVARGVRPGQRLFALINGKREPLQVVGIGLSPEYIFAGMWGSPDQRGFGVFWLDREVLGSAYDMRGAFNQVAVRLAPGASEGGLIDALNRTLTPYGGDRAHGRDSQMSHMILDSEIKEQRVLGTVLPTIFLAVAAFLLNVVLSRLVATQREQIAALKALGYASWTIGQHYLKLVLLVVGLGTVIGVLAGARLGSGFVDLYAEVFRFPELAYRLDPWLVLVALAVSVLAALLATLQAISATMRLAPAEAMRAPSPGVYRPMLIERLGLQAWFSPGVRMVLRTMGRRWVRTTLTVAGVAAAMAIVISGAFWRDAIGALMNTQFNLVMRGDVTMALLEASPASVGQEVARLPHVVAWEGARSVPVRLVNGHRSWRGQLQGREAEPQLQRVLDLQHRIYAMPEDGLLITDRLADRLGVGLGDVVQVERLDANRARLALPVRTVVQEMMGMNAYMERGSLNRWLGEADLVNQLSVQLERQHEGEFLAMMPRLPRVLVAVSKSLMQRNIEEVSARNVLIFSAILSVFAVIIAFGVVYNQTRIALAERAWELASLRVLGFTRAEVSGFLLGELAMEMAMALPLGMWLGYALASTIVELIKTDEFYFPMVIAPATYAYAVWCVLIAGVASALIVRRRVDRLDLIGVLKTRE
jgi:putative ABC transport system permease protein